jgi:hypothetical protein
MVKRHRLKFWARQIEIWHFIIFILTLASLAIIFLSKEYRLYAAIFLALVYIIEEIYGFCPLTRLENLLLRAAGIDIKKKKYMPRFFEKYFKIKIPEWLAGIAMLLFFIIAIVVITLEVFCI